MSLGEVRQFKCACCQEAFEEQVGASAFCPLCRSGSCHGCKKQMEYLRGQG